MSASSKKTKCPKCCNVVKNVDSICCDICDNWLHIKCTKLTKAKFKNILEDPSSKFVCFYCKTFPCGTCAKGVFPSNNALFCESYNCNNWFHLKCTKVSLDQYKLLSRSDYIDPWNCDSCLSIPFSGISDFELKKLCQRPVLECLPFKLTGFPDKCAVCSRKISKNKKIKCFPCSSCNCLVHRKCTNLPLSHMNSMSKNDILRWECAKCYMDKFPFGETSNTDIVGMTFNSNYDCPCQNNCQTSIIKRNLYRLDLFKNKNDKFYINVDPLDELEEKEKISINFDYYEDHEFHKFLASRKSYKKNSFSLFHTNIQSIHNKLDLLNLTLTNLGHHFDVLALSETWIDQNDKKTQIVGNLDGYNKFLSKHGNSLKGGCGFFVKTELQVLERKKLDISFTDSNNEYEAKWIEKINKGKKNVIIGVCYRHPRKKSDESFNQYLEKTLWYS